MTAVCLVTGELFREPQAKVSKGGKDYCTATLRVADGDGATFWNIVAFGSASEELARLCAGEALSAQGKLKAETYQKDGETRISLSILANNVLALRAPTKAKAPSGANATKTVANATPAPPSQPQFDDDFPDDFGGPR